MSRAVAAEVIMSGSRTIGEILLSRRLITHALLEEAVAAQQETGKPLGQILVETGAITRLELASALAEQWGDAGTISPTFPGGSEYIEPAGASDTATHLAEIRRERRELEARMLELDRGVDAELHGELTSVVEALGSRIEGLEARLAGLRTSEDAAALDELRDALAQLAGRLASVEPEIAGLRSVVGASASASALEQGLGEVAAAVDRVAPRVEHAERSAAAVESRMDELSALVAQALTQLRQSAADTATAQAELAERVADASTRASHEELASALADLRTSVAEIAGRPAADPILADRLDEVSRLVEELAARPQADPALAVRMDELAERLDLGARGDSDAGGADSRVDALIARVAELASRPASDPELDSRVAGLADRLQEMAARQLADDGLRAQVTELSSRLEAVDDRAAVRLLEERLDAALSRLDDAVTPSSADAELRVQLDVLAARLDEISARPADALGLEERLVAIAGRVDELSQRGLVDPVVEARLESLAERLEEVSRSASERVADADGATSARVEALDTRLADLESRPAADGLVERLGELEAAVHALRDTHGAPPSASIDEELAPRLRVIDDAAQSLAQELASATTAWAEDRRDLEARLEWLAARVEAELSTAAQAAPGPPPEPAGRPAAGATVQSSDGDVEKLRMAVERLMLDFAEHRRALSAAMAGRGLEEQVRLLAEQVADLQFAGPVTNGAGPADGGGDRAFASEVRALTGRLGEVEAATVAARDTMLARLERMMGTIDWRLQRLEKPESQQ